MSAGTNNPESSAAASAHFVTTHWSVVLRAGHVESAGGAEALSELCQTYWYPLYAYVRRQGHPPHDAEDLTQGFFARLLEKNYVADARREKGRFRTFLLTALKHYLANEWDRQHAQKRGGFHTVISIDGDEAESRFSEEPVHDVTPEVLFERQWAVALLDHVVARLQEEYAGTGRGALFDELRGTLTSTESVAPYAVIAARLNVSEVSVKMAVRRLRARYREILREEIARTVDSPEHIEEEITHLFTAFGP